MKTNRFKTLITLLLSWIIWFISLNLILSVSEYENLYKNPNIRVQLYEPLFALSTVDGINNSRFEWAKVESGFVVNRYEDTIELSKEYPAYIDVDNSLLEDAQTDNGLALSKTEIIRLLTDLCDGKTEQYNLNFELDGDSGVMSDKAIDLPDEFKINVIGRYKGYLLINTHRQTIPIKDTDFEQTNIAFPGVPYKTIFICLAGSLLAALIFIIVGVIIARIIENGKMLFIIPSVSSLLILTIALLNLFCIKTR